MPNYQWCIIFFSPRLLDSVRALGAEGRPLTRSLMVVSSSARMSCSSRLLELNWVWWSWIVFSCRSHLAYKSQLSVTNTRMSLSDHTRPAGHTWPTSHSRMSPTHRCHWQTTHVLPVTLGLQVTAECHQHMDVIDRPHTSCRSHLAYKSQPSVTNTRMSLTDHTRPAGHTWPTSHSGVYSIRHKHAVGCHWQSRHTRPLSMSISYFKYACINTRSVKTRFSMYHVTAAAYPTRLMFSHLCAMCI